MASSLGNSPALYRAATRNRFAPQPAAFINLHHINRNVLRLEPHKTFNGIAPGIRQSDAAIPQSNPKSNSEIPQPAKSKPHAEISARRCMRPAAFNSSIIKRLRPQANAIKSRRQPSLRFFPRNRLGISLKRRPLQYRQSKFALSAEPKSAPNFPAPANSACLRQNKRYRKPPKHRRAREFQSRGKPPAHKARKVDEEKTPVWKLQ